MAVLLYGESSALWGGFLSERSERNQRPAGESRNRTGGGRPVLHAVFPQAPVYERRLPVVLEISSGGQYLSGLLFLHRATGPCSGANKRPLRGKKTAWRGKARKDLRRGGSNCNFLFFPTDEKRNEVSHKAFLLPFFSKKGSKRGVGWQTVLSLLSCMRRTNFITWEEPIWTTKRSAA